MRDFSTMLQEMVMHKKGKSFLEADVERMSNARTAGRPTKKTLMDDFNKLFALAQEMQAEFQHQMEDVEKVMQPIFAKIKHDMGGVKTTFAGLKHMTQEQQKHIGELVNQANEKVKSLQGMVASTQEINNKLQAKIDTGDAETVAKNKELQTKVTELESKISSKAKEYASAMHDKEMELQGREQDFDDVVGSYEKAMHKMKKSEMMAREQIRQLEEELNAEFEYAHYEPEGEPITEAVVSKPKKKKKKKLADVENYGTFDLHEHLAKAREALPKARHDW